MTPEQNIEKFLKGIEDEFAVDIIFAVESGSRMWGFASSDSDYDVRFVYKRRDKEFYNSFLNIGAPYKDTISFITSDRIYDFSGWDIAKFCRHVHTSNVSIIEWCHSDIVYRDELGIKSKVKEIVRKYTYPHFLKFPYEGMFYSKKCCGVESIKRGMYSARILMVLYILHYRKKLPNGFTWKALTEEIKETDYREFWTVKDLEMMNELYTEKIKAKEKDQVPREELKSFLVDKQQMMKKVLDATKGPRTNLLKEEIEKGEAVEELFSTLINFDKV